MNNLNPYNQVDFKSKFETSPIAKAIAQDYDILGWANTFTRPIDYSYTQRQLLGDKTLIDTSTYFSMVAFYYLEKLLEKNPATIYDLGCGWNIFKRYIPNIVGVDTQLESKPFFADINDLVDDDYIQYHQNFFESVFAINMLHYRSIKELEKIIAGFVSMVKPGGRGFFTLNLHPLVINTPVEDLIEVFSSATPTTNQFEIFIRNILDNIVCHYLVVDINFSNGINNGLDGNVRVVFERI